MIWSLVGVSPCKLTINKHKRIRFDIDALLLPEDVETSI